MDDETETELTPWQELGAIDPERSLPVRRSSALPAEVRRADIFDLHPVNRDEFFAAVGPCLALVGGVGMTADDQRTWLEAAFKALDGIPIRLLERGATEAMRKADHPSKIVATIIAEVGADWKGRREARSTNMINWDAQSRMDAVMSRLKQRDVSQAEFDAMPQRWRDIAETRGLVRADYTVRLPASVVPA